MISLIPKKDKDITILDNMRPITLLSIYYKIISGGLSNRLKIMLDKVIHPNQKAYLKGRYLGEITRSIMDVMEELERENKSAAVILVDFSKAFDSKTPLLLMFYA